MRIRAAAPALGACLWLFAAPAAATSTTFFGEDVPPGGGLPASFPNANAKQAEFLSMLVDPGTEDFSAFHSEDEAPLDLRFRNPAGSGAVVETGTLTDPSDSHDGFIATALIAKTGFPISGTTYWKNTTEAEDDANDGLFHVDFDHAVRAFGFYAMAYSTLSKPGGTQLVLDLELEGGGTVSFTIPNDVTDTLTGKVLYFGVITDPFVAATLRNSGEKDGDVIGFDDFTVAHVVVPEPGTGLLLGAGMLVVAGMLHRSRRRRA
jgi:hypothetical protein